MSWNAWSAWLAQPARTLKPEPTSPAWKSNYLPPRSTRSGKERLVSPPNPPLDFSPLPQFEQLLRDAVDLYTVASLDPVTAPAAYGYAVESIRRSCGVSLRTACLIFSAALDRPD